MFNHAATRRSRKFEAPSSKHQGTSKPQAQSLLIEVWNFVWSLGFGTWNFPRSRDSRGWNDTARVGAERGPANIRVSSGALAQLVRAPPCHGGGCGFEPRRLRGFRIIYLFAEVSAKCWPHDAEVLRADRRLPLRFTAQRQDTYAQLVPCIRT